MMYWKLNIKLQALLSAGVFTLLPGCYAGTPTIEHPKHAEFRLVEFISSESTTRGDILLRLGTPSEHFDGERNLSFLMIVGEDGDLHAVPKQSGYRDKWNDISHNLVIIFGPDGSVERFNLISVGRRGY